MFGTYESETRDGARRCVFCGEWKPLDIGYHRNGGTEHRLDCKVCYNIRRQQNKAKKMHSDFIGGQKRRGEDAPAFSHQDWKEVLIYFNGECAYCGCTPRRSVKLTKDHVVPISTGGRTVPSNMVPACSSCNSSKNSEEFKTWFMKQPFFSQERLNRVFKWRAIMKEVYDE